MGVGNYLSIRSHESARAAQGLLVEEPRPARHGIATLLAFVAAGSVPLAPYVLPSLDHAALVSIIFTFSALFGVGALRSLVTIDRWWTAGLEMLGLGLSWHWRRMPPGRLPHDSSLRWRDDASDASSSRPSDLRRGECCRQGTSK